MELSKRLFQGYLEEGEEIFFIIHHHIISIFKPISQILVLFILIPLGLWYLFPIVSFFALISIIIGLFKIGSILLSWYFNALLITNLNLLDIERKGIFNKQANRIEYGQVEAFSYTINGFFNTIFNFGDIIIQKNSGQTIELKGAFRPRHKSQFLTKIQEQMVDQQLKKDHEGLKTVLTNMLRSHIQEHGITVIDE